MWFGAVLVLALIVGGAARLGLALASNPGATLQASDSRPALARGDTGSSSRADGSSSARHSVRPTPAGLARPAPSQVAAERPQVLTLPSGTKMDVRVSATGASGQLGIPTNINRAGWWNGSSRLGDPFGAVVIAAHVDSFTQGVGRMAELLGVHRGDVLRVASRHLAQRFRVTSAGLVPKSSLTASSDVYSAQGSPRLVLITCGGAYDPSAGGYLSNMVVVAVPQGRLAVKR